MLIVNEKIRIPEHELDFSFARSSGPGGQNVNKVNSKAVLRWNVRESVALGPFQRMRVIGVLGPKLTSAGDLVISSDRFRDQGRNREDCLDKLREMVARAAEVPKARKESKPSRSS